jgi:hypothetical protein
MMASIWPPGAMISTNLNLYYVPVRKLSCGLGLFLSCDFWEEDFSNIFQMHFPVYLTRHTIFDCRLFRLPPLILTTNFCVWFFFYLVTFYTLLTSLLRIKVHVKIVFPMMTPSDSQEPWFFKAWSIDLFCTISESFHVIFFGPEFLTKLFKWPHAIFAIL